MTDGLPYGRAVELPGRGTTFVREVAGPPGAPTVVLVHGLVASGGLNWFQVFEPLGRHFHVLAPDLRGHGRGIRTRGRFRLADCADDLVALLDVLDVDEAIFAGYSMGGPVAQLVWRRHAERVAGLVFCATTDRLLPGVRERLMFVSAMAAASGGTRLGQVLTEAPSRWVRDRLAPMDWFRSQGLRGWAAAEMRRHDWRMVAEAAAAVGNYDASRWIGEIDVPTAVLVTTDDRAIPPREQLRLWVALPGARLHRIADGHTTCARPSFAEPFVAACLDVAGRDEEAEPAQLVAD